MIPFSPIPKGSIGKQFMQEMSRFLIACNTNSNKKTIALKSSMIFPSLVTQKISFKSKPSNNKEHVTQRLEMWKENKFAELLLEQKHPPEDLQKSMKTATSNKITHYGQLTKKKKEKERLYKGHILQIKHRSFDIFNNRWYTKREKIFLIETR